MAALAQFDPALVDALAAASPDALRGIARWAARRACEEAQLTRAGWVTAALDAMDRGEPLPAELGGPVYLSLRVMAGDPDIPHTTVTSLLGTPGLHQQPPALAAWMAVGGQDPLAAAATVLWKSANAFGASRYQVLFSGLRTAFPAVFS
jgi:hypothetical protein